MVQAQANNNRHPRDDIDEVHGRLFVGGSRAAMTLDTVNRCGITHILSLIQDSNEIVATMFKNQIDYKVLKNLQDDDSQQISDLFAEANGFIREALSGGQDNKVLINCPTGNSLSAAFCTAFLIGECGLTFEQAMTQGGSNRANSFQPNVNFQNQLKAFESNPQPDEHQV